MNLFDALSDELLDLIISDCGAHSLTVLIPHVAKRWNSAAARVLENFVHLDPVTAMAMANLA